MVQIIIVQDPFNTLRSPRGWIFPLLQPTLVRIGNPTDAPDAKSNLGLSPFSSSPSTSVLSIPYPSSLLGSAPARNLRLLARVSTLAFREFPLLSLTRLWLPNPPRSLRIPIPSRHHGRFPSESARSHTGPAFWRPPMAHLRQGL